MEAGIIISIQKIIYQVFFWGKELFPKLEFNLIIKFRLGLGLITSELSSVKTGEGLS